MSPASICQARKTPVMIRLKIPFAECEILCKHQCLGIIQKILARTRWKSFKGGLVSHPLWKVPCWLVSGKPRSSSHIHLAAGDNSSAREGSTMGKRPQFSHNGTVTVTRKKHRQRAKHATPSSGTGCEWWGRGCCASAHGAGAGAGPGPALPEAAPHPTAASTRRHCSVGPLSPQLYPVPWLL